MNDKRSFIYFYWKWRSSQVLLVLKPMLPTKLKHRIIQRKAKSRRYIKGLKNAASLNYTENGGVVVSNHAVYSDDILLVERLHDRLIQLEEEKASLKRQNDKLILIGTKEENPSGKL